jgi:iron(III) transport system ATP-binding protein
LSGIEFQDISKAYDAVAALKQVSVTIAGGNHTSILGPSGCGKSTFLRVLAGLEQPSSGKILIDGTLVSESTRILVAPHQRRIAMVFQDLALWPNLPPLKTFFSGYPARI